METDKVQQFMKLKTKVVFGESFLLDRMTRILGGAQKHTYLAETENGFYFVNLSESILMDCLKR